MLWMETIAKIRRRHIQEGESISSIARDLHLSRATVCKYLQDDQIQSGYKRTIQPKPKLGEFESVLEAWLLKESYLPKRQRRTARRLFEGLVAQGYRYRKNAPCNSIRGEYNPARQASTFLQYR